MSICSKVQNINKINIINKTNIINKINNINSITHYHSTTQLFFAVKPQKEKPSNAKAAAAGVKGKEGGKEGGKEEGKEGKDKKPKVWRHIKGFLFKQFLANEGKLYEHPKLNGPNYMGSAFCPFPMNPYFKVQPPLTDRTREQIWNEYTEQGKTVREIDFALNMEKMLGAKTILSENLTETLPQVGKPKFHLVDEGKDFVSDDAAKILNRPTIKEETSREELLRQQFTTSLGGKSKNQHLRNVIEIGSDKEITNRRWAFRFKNVGENPCIIIRERDGKLLKADLPERSPLSS
ncbi:4261_t:CDS:2 [Diversispora eburnea]|uniref:4261_t:CDS:1 n=1 Tax=Diversispora eburnea TaxID=1213867 RepID=A0A9N9FZN2_9GLOM|nr:4261_t:CDS:2 [Diversispora eburnea]